MDKKIETDLNKALDPYASRQHLLHHAYSPLISIQASIHADQLLQASIGSLNLSILQFIKPYGNNAKQIHPGQSFKITNSQLITKTYPSFPVRFEPPLPELLSIVNASTNNNSADSNPSNAPNASNSSNSLIKSPPLKQLFSNSSLELLLKHRSKAQTTTDSNLYLEFFTKIITSNNIVPFETFNHPVSQIFVIDYHKDTLDDLRHYIVAFRNYNFPKYFQIDDLLMHVFVFYDPNLVSNPLELSEYQNRLKSNLSTSCTMIPIELKESWQKSDHQKSVTYRITDYSTIDEDLQRITLEQNDLQNAFQVPESLDNVMKRKVFDFVSRLLIPHMENRVRLWDDLVLSPKKSITGRFFSVSRMIFQGGSSNSGSPEPHSGGGSGSLGSSQFNYQENYYHKTSQEQIIRKLADWSLILKDFKYAYSTYDLIKKDFSNDKAWVYVASVQEICIVSLLFAQTQQTQPPQVPDRNTLRKIRHDIIEPYCDNLLYTFKSRFNLKSYGIKALIVIIELLLCMCLHFQNGWWWNDLIEKYLEKCISEFYPKLIPTSLAPVVSGGGQVIRALLCDRLGYTFTKCAYSGGLGNRLVKNFKLHDSKVIRDGNGQEDLPTDLDLYTNTNKLHQHSVHHLGFSRYRKASLWYLLAMKEWLDLEDKPQIEVALKNILVCFPQHLTENWYDRESLLLGKIKRFLG